MGMRLTHDDLPHIQKGQKLVYRAGSDNRHCYGLVEVIETNQHSVQVKILQLWSVGRDILSSVGQIINAALCELEREN